MRVADASGSCDGQASALLPPPDLGPVGHHSIIHDKNRLGVYRCAANGPATPASPQRTALHPMSTSSM